MDRTILLIRFLNELPFSFSARVLSSILQVCLSVFLRMKSRFVMFWVISVLQLQSLTQSWYWTRLAQVGAVPRQTWVRLQRVFWKEIFRQFLFIFGNLRLSLQDNLHSIDPCCSLKLSRLLVSMFQPSFLLLYFSWILSWNYLPINQCSRSIVSNFCTVKLWIAMAQDSYRVRIQLAYLFFNTLDYPAAIEIICTNGTGYWTTGQILYSQKNILLPAAVSFNGPAKSIDQIWNNSLIGILSSSSFCSQELAFWQESQFCTKWPKSTRSFGHQNLSWQSCMSSRNFNAQFHHAILSWHMYRLSLLFRIVILPLFFSTSYRHAYGNASRVFWLLVQHLKMVSRCCLLTGTTLLNSNLVPALTLRLNHPLEQIDKDSPQLRLVDLVGIQLQNRIQWRCVSILRFFLVGLYYWWHTSKSHDPWTTWTSVTRGNVQTSSMRTELLALLFRKSIMSIFYYWASGKCLLERVEWLSHWWSPLELNLVRILLWQGSCNLCEIFDESPNIGCYSQERS